MPLALDSFPTPPTCAAGLRRMLSSHAGAIARADHDAVPFDVGFLADDSLDRYTVEINQDNSAPMFWLKMYDQSGNGIDAVSNNQQLKIGLNKQGSLIGDRIGSCGVGQQWTIDAGAPAHTTLVTTTEGTIIVVCQCWSDDASNNGVFATGGGWIGATIYNPGAISNLALEAEAWMWTSGPKFASQKIPFNRYSTNVLVWRHTAGTINVCVNGTWGVAHATGGPIGGGGNTIGFGGGAFSGQIVEFLTLDYAATDEQIAAYGREASAYYGGHWPAEASGPSGGVPDLAGTNKGLVG
jgi:hypothetical protein